MRLLFTVRRFCFTPTPFFLRRKTMLSINDIKKAACNANQELYFIHLDPHAEDDMNINIMYYHKGDKQSLIKGNINLKDISAIALYLAMYNEAKMHAQQDQSIL